MANNVGFKIGIEGEREFKQNLKEINTSMKTLGSEMKLVSAQFDKNDKSTEALTSRNKVLNKEIEAQKDKIAMLQKAMENASESFGKADSRTQKWEQELNNSKASLVKMERELEQNNNELKKAGNRFEHAKDKAHQFGVKMKSVGSVVGSACKAAIGAIAGISTAVVAVGKKLTELTTETAEHGNEIDKYRQKLGLSSKAYQEWDYVLSQSDVDITSLTTGMKTMTNQIDDAKNGSEKAADRFKKLGISTQDLKSMSREEVFNAVIKGFQGMSDSTERAALANDLFGKSGQNLTPLFNQSVESTEALKKAAHDLGYVMSDEAVNASAKYMDSLDSLKKSFTGFKNNLLGELLPGFTTIMDGLSGLLAGTDGASDKLKSGAKQLSDELASVMPNIASILTSLTTSILEIAPVVIDSLLTGIFDNLPQLLSAAGEIIVTLATGIESNIDIIASSGLDILLSLVDELCNNLPMLLQVGLDAIVHLALGIAEALPELVPTLISTITSIVEVLTDPDNLFQLLDAAIAIIFALGQGLIDSLPDLLARLPEIISNVVETLISLGPTLWSAAFQLIVQLGLGLIRCIPDLLSYLPRLISSMVEHLIHLAKRFAEVGKNLVHGIWDGIKNAVQWIKDKIKGWVGNILTFIKNLFGIHSPSTVMRDQVGSFLAKGIGLGFTDEMKNVERQMADSIPKSFDIVPQIKSTINAAGATVSDGSGRYNGSTTNLIVNLQIGEFINERKDDINALADELSIVLAHKIQRRSEAF